MKRSTDGFEPLRRYPEHGFTLIEMMVALFIFAMIAAAGVSLLSFGVRAQTAATTRLDDVAGVRRMSVLLANDLAQSVPRVARGSDGSLLRAFTGNDGRSDPLVMGYVRGGWTNPDGKARPGIQRVDVTLDKGRLERRAYAAPDGDSVATAILLADNVTTVAMRYRDKRGEWRDRWDSSDIALLPAAVEMTVTRANDPPLTLAFMAGPAYP
jgi:general secretion pathway protein J